MFSVPALSEADKARLERDKLRQREQERRRREAEVRIFSVAKATLQPPMCVIYQIPQTA